MARLVPRDFSSRVGLPARQLIRPSLSLAVTFNAALRESDEWFDEPDDLDRVQRAIDSMVGETSVLDAVALLMARLTRAQGFNEGNKRTALALGAWMLVQNGRSPEQFLKSDDDELLVLLLQAARGADISDLLVALLRSRAAL